MSAWRITGLLAGLLVGATGANAAPQPGATVTVLYSGPTTVAYASFLQFGASVSTPTGAATGTVNFYMCAAGVDPCATGGTSIGSATLQGGPPPNGGTAPFVTPTPGTYCVRADYLGDASWAAASSDGAKCFTVTKAPPPLGAGLDNSNIAIGTPTDTLAADIVTVGDGIGLAPTGTVTFSVCGPLASAAGCPSGGASDGSTGLSTGMNPAMATSADYNPSTPGWYCFRADYSGDSNYSAVSDTSADACVQARYPVTLQQSPNPPSEGYGASQQGNVVISDDGKHGRPTGTVHFYACGPLTSASGCPTGGQDLGAAPADPYTVNASLSATAPWHPGAGTWCYRAVYSGDGTYIDATDSTAAGCFVISQGSTSTGSSPQDTSIALGGATTDAATVSAGYGTPTGTVTFYTCGPSASSCASGGTKLGTQQQLTAGMATSPNFTPQQPGTYCWRADYGGDTNDLGSSDGGSTCFTVTKASPTLAAAAQAPTSTLLGSNTDAVTVTGNAVGGTPTGKVTFSVCGPAASACATGGTQLGTATTLTAAAADTATASSPAFTPTAPGTWCFRADYAGDSSYAAGSAATASACFTVPAPPAPSATITSPSNGAYHVVGQTVTAGYACADSAGGTGIASCAGSIANGAPIDTSLSALGWHTVTVTATSKDRETTTAHVSYRVIRPPNHATVSDIKTNPNGAVSFTISVPNPGAVDVMLTSWSNNLAHASYLLAPAPRRFVFGRKHVELPHAGTYRITAKPGARGRQLIVHHHYNVHVRLWVSYTPTNGRQLNLGFYRIPISR